MTDPASRARVALAGLHVGDCFGQQFFRDEDDGLALVRSRTLPPGPWPYTDDTLMGAAVCGVLVRHGSVDQDALAAAFAAGYSFDRGYGPAMHRQLMRVAAGEHWDAVARGQFGGAGSFGNGAAMRAAPVGAYFADDVGHVVSETERSAVVTHTHPDGVAGAVAVAVAAALVCDPTTRNLSPADFLLAVADRTPTGEVCARLVTASALPEGASVRLAAAVLGNGVQLSAADTVPFALWCAARHRGDFATGMWEAVSAGGDRDTVCAIAGGVLALCDGAVPAEWAARCEVAGSSEPRP